MPTGEYEDMKCDLVRPFPFLTHTVCCCQLIRSIGYKTVAVDRAVPCDPVTGTVPNIAGRVLDSECVRAGGGGGGEQGNEQ